MCGRYALFKLLDEIDHFLGTLERDNTIEPNYNVAPTHRMPVAYSNIDGARVLEDMSWGFVGWKPKPGQKAFTPVNTRDDSIGPKPMWTRAFKSKRCIVPMNGFFEWKGSKGNKTPFLIKPKDGGLLGAAGIYSELSLDVDSQIKTYSIITTSPNSLMKDIHDRMPAFLHPTEFSDWLNPNHSDEYLKGLLRPYPDDALEAFIVSKEVGNVRNNNPSLIEPASLF